MALRMDDCWNRIGVRGDASCPELVASVHCRNCGVYSAAAARLLDRDLTEDRLDEATEDVSRVLQPSATDAASAIIFRVGAEWFALSPLAFDEIAEPRTIRPLPHRRGGAVLGLVNVRGELVVCLSLAHVMGLADAAQVEDHGAPHAGRLIVLSHAEGRVAFPVEEVRSIHAYEARELKALPATVSRTAANFADGLLAWRGRAVGHLDSGRLAETLNRSLT